MDHLRDRIITELGTRQIGVLIVRTFAGILATPVRFRNRGIAVDCLLPRWADAGYYVEENPRAMVVLCVPGEEQRWLQYRGTAERVLQPDWTGLLPPKSPSVAQEPLYLVLHITPTRVEISGEGWGVRETFDIQNGGDLR